MTLYPFIDQCVFLGKVLFYIFFEVTGIHLHFLVRLADTIFYPQFVKQRPFFSFAPNIST